MLCCCYLGLLFALKPLLDRFDGDGCVHACMLEQSGHGGELAAFYARELVTTHRLRAELLANEAVFPRVSRLILLEPVVLG